MGNKNKSVSSNEKSQKPKESKGKKDKKGEFDKIEELANKEIEASLIWAENQEDPDEE